MWLYKEDDWIAEVDILDDLSDRHREAYTLKVMKTIQESSLRQTRPVGEIFTCWKERNANPIYSPVLWQIGKIGDRSLLSASTLDRRHPWGLRLALVVSALFVFFRIRNSIFALHP
ncbi:MAG: hypothetical protein KF893_05720 [Caldilineaceae bacterium]|nr:hypothetical protein [Caldilineaceae bacterium]